MSINDPGVPGATPTPQDEIKRVVTRNINVKAIVETVDPRRHDPTVEYQFSNGRIFKRKPYE